MKQFNENTAKAGFSFNPFAVIAAQTHKKRTIPC